MGDVDDLAELFRNFLADLRVILQELAGVLAALADADIAVGSSLVSCPFFSLSASSILCYWYFQ